MYNLIKTSFGKEVIIRDNSDGTQTSFSEDPANTDYQAFLAWLAEGNTPNPYIPPPPAPEPTIEEKLASVGLSIDDLKAALGIK
jgi:hypothetical protein